MLNDAQRLTRTHYAILFLAWAGWMFDFYDLILFVFLKGAIGKSLGIEKAALLHIGMYQLLMTGVGGVVAGWLADRVGRKPVLQWTILVYCLGTCVCAFTQSAGQLLCARMLTGIGVGGEWAIGHTLMGEVAPPRSRGRLGGLLQTGAPLGVGLANLVGSFFAPWTDVALAPWLGAGQGWRAAFLLSALPALLVVGVRRWMPESDVWLAHRGTRETFGRDALLQLFGRELRYLTLTTFVLCVTNGASYWLTYFWFPEILKDHHLDIHAAGWWLFIVIWGEVIGYSIFGWVSDRLGRRPAFSLFAWTMAGGLLSIGALWKVSGEGVPVWVRWALLAVGIGTGTWSCFGPLFAELFPTRVRNTAAGTIFNLSRSAQFFSLWTLALFPEQGQLSAGLLLAGSCALAASGIVWALPETKGRRVETLAAA